jgi:DNA invertase Pin-like site-specific DNA recombinase
MLVVTRLDRLARSTRDLLNILHDLKEKGAGVKSPADPWCDTSWMYSELLVTVLAGFATFERQLIKTHTDDEQKARPSPWRAFWSAKQTRCPSASEEQRRKHLQAIAASRGLPSGSMSSLASGCGAALGSQ